MVLYVTLKVRKESYNIMSDFSNSLCRLISDRNISQSKLAEDLGLKPASVSRYCRGKQSPRDNVKEKIAEYFGVTVAEMLGGTDKPSRPEKDDGGNEDSASRIITLLPDLNIRELESVKSYADYLIQKKLYTEDITDNEK